MAFRSNAPAAVSFVGGGGGGGRLQRTSYAAADITKSNRRRSYEPLFSHSDNHLDIDIIKHYRGQQPQRRGWHSSNTNMVNTATRLHMSDMTVQEESSTTIPPQTATTTTTTSTSTSYPFATVEAKWQSYWKEHHTFATPSRRIVNQDGTVTRSTKKKKYVLDMFPYPSGAGLHVGHPEGYTGQSVSCCVFTCFLS